MDPKIEEMYIVLLFILVRREFMSHLMVRGALRGMTAKHEIVCNYARAVV